MRQRPLSSSRLQKSWLTRSPGLQGITNVDLAGRPKNLYAVWRKMQAKGCGLEGLYDLRALRLVVRGPKGRAACYDLLKQVRLRLIDLLHLSNKGVRP